MPYSFAANIAWSFAMVDFIIPVTFNHIFARALIQNENELHTMHLISIKTLYRLMRLEVKMRYAYVLTSVKPKISVKTLYRRLMRLVVKMMYHV